MASVNKRTWKGPDGKEKSGYEVRYKEGGKHRSKTFKLFKQADAFRKKVEREMDDGVHIADSDKKTVDDVCEAFMRLQEDRMRNGIIGRGRYDNIKKSVDLNIKPLLGKRLIADVTEAEVETWFHAIIRQQKLSPQTARTRLIDLKCVFQYAGRYGIVKKNPAQAAISQIGGVPRVKIKTFDKEDVVALFQALTDRPFRYRERSIYITRAFVYLACLCGLRLGEIRALSRRHVDFARGIIEVRASMTDRFEMKGPKTRAGIRDVPMPAIVAAVLREAVENCYVDNKEELIFTTSSGCGISTGSFRNEMWYPLLRRAGLYMQGDKQMHFHALRHFYCSMLMHGGVGPSDMAALAGHSNFDVTLQVYAHPVLKGAARAEPSERLAALLLPPPTRQLDAKPVE